MEGERYKKSPELLLQAVNHLPKMEAPCQFITWKRWDKDVSVRPFVPETMLTFAVPMKKFTKMVRNMVESFLTTSSWNKVRYRISSV
jgi:hypothetical protein